jgi:HlyD family secretion protein
LLQALAQYAADKQALASALAEARSVEDSARQELAAAEQVRAKLAQTLPHYQSEEKSYRELAEQGYVGRLMANEKSRDRIEREQDLYAQEATLQAIRAKIRQAQEKIRQLDADHRAKLHAERLEAVAQFEKLRQELSKQSRRNALLELKAPQDGIIKDLATHTAGTVVSPGTILMTLVPDAERLRAEVWIQNDDIGFVRPDMPVKLKLSAYPFQKYGMLSGKVIHVGADAADENKNNAQDSSHDVVTGHLLYRTLVQLDTPYLIADGHRHRLTPGMQVVAEVRLGERSVLEYVLSPVQKALQEAARER